MIERLTCENFTAFDRLDLSLAGGLNVFIGENGTGKTHILKAVYAACDITRSQKSFAEKITKVFLPSGDKTGRLARRSGGSVRAFVEVARRVGDLREPVSIRLSFSNHVESPERAQVSGDHKQWMEHPLESVYIPVKDMMANAPRFRSLYSLRDIHFEEVYADIIDRAFRPPLRGPTDSDRKRLLEILQRSMDGRVVNKNEEFFLRNGQGELEFTLLAEGLRKLALLWVLIQNGNLLRGSVLCWDEPETNLNPRLMRTVVGILVELQRLGVQVLVSTHDYVILKEFDLQTTEKDGILYHSLYRDQESAQVRVASTDRYLDISPNAIDDTFAGLVDREVGRSMQGLGT